MIKVLTVALRLVEEVSGDLVFKVFEWWWDRTEVPVWSWDEGEELL